MPPNLRRLRVSLQKADFILEFLSKKFELSSFKFRHGITFIIESYKMLCDVPSRDGESSITITIKKLPSFHAFEKWIYFMSFRKVKRLAPDRLCKKGK